MNKPLDGFTYQQLKHAMEHNRYLLDQLFEPQPVTKRSEWDIEVTIGEDSWCVEADITEAQAWNDLRAFYSIWKYVKARDDNDLLPEEIYENRRGQRGPIEDDDEDCE